MGKDGGRWWGGVDEVTVVVGSCVRLRKPGLQVLAQNPETGPLGLGLGRAVGNSGGGRWGEMVVWCGQGYGGGGVARWAAQARVVGFGPKARNWPTRARFGVRCWKQKW